MQMINKLNAKLMALSILTYMAVIGILGGFKLHENYNEFISGLRLTQSELQKGYHNLLVLSLIGLATIAVGSLLGLIISKKFSLKNWFLWIGITLFAIAVWIGFESFLYFGQISTAGSFWFKAVPVIGLVALIFVAIVQFYNSLPDDVKTRLSKKFKKA